MNAVDFIADLKKKATNSNVKIVFPEGDDPRVIKAAQIIEHERLAVPILTNDVEYAINLLQTNEVAGLVMGATHSTKDTFKTAIKKIGTIDRFASSYFIMLKEEKIYFYADCGMNINPNAEQLAKIVLQTVNSVKLFRINPRIAMLSFSTKGSANDESIDKINEAIRIVKEKDSELVIDGELQFDAAIIAEIAQKKAKDSIIKGDANVFIFPDLNAGNIAYKITERLGGFRAIGPITQGFKKPINDLSRGCSVEDIVLVTAITVLQSKH